MGLATARELVSRGDSVIAAVRDPARAVESGVEFIKFDAMNPQAMVLPEVLDGLVYFPGTIALKPFHRLSAGDFLQDFQINCLGAVVAIQAALPSLKVSPGGASVVLFSSVAVVQGMAFHASIAAAKGAVEGLAKSLAAELAPKIRVNVIAPSLTDTPLAGGLLNHESKREASAKRHPMQQVGRAEDVASLVTWLLSDHAGFMTGQVLRPDGGLSSVRAF